MNEQAEERGNARYERVVIPRVDILENANEIVLTADLPGVDEKTLSITAEKGILSIYGTVALQTTEGYELIRSERRADVYQREFQLSDTINTENIRARIKNGVLTLTLPKREEAKARKIEVIAA